MEPTASLSQRLKGARESIGRTEQQVSKDTGIARESIIEWESGSRVPSISYLTRLADYYGFNVAYFLDQNAPEVKIAFRHRRLTDHDREVIYWARRVLSDYWTMKSLQARHT